jgi:hypothetical protein
VQYYNTYFAKKLVNSSIIYSHFFEEISEFCKNFPHTFSMDVINNFFHAFL